MIQVVKIIKIEKHPDAAKLKLCTVSNGSTETIVVCGAANARESMLTVLAEVGDTLPTGLTIQKSNLRGVDSFGMLCSAKDLSVSKETGIVDLPEGVNLGSRYTEVPVENLSSTPWHTYKLTETLRKDPSSNQIRITRNSEEANSNWPIVSQTFYHEGKYLYRNFL